MFKNPIHNKLMFPLSYTLSVMVGGNMDGWEVVNNKRLMEEGREVRREGGREGGRKGWIETLILRVLLLPWSNVTHMSSYATMNPLKILII
jgi:hypothetical protein